jgi:hypothetical protein
LSHVFFWISISSLIPGEEVLKHLVSHRELNKKIIVKLNFVQQKHVVIYKLC